jgi:hypothetical protein
VVTPPKPPSSTDERVPLLDELDQMTAEQLADYFYALAEEIISNPKEYKMKMGLEQLDLAEFDNIDLSTPEGRKKLAQLFRLLAMRVLTQGKDAYLSSVQDKSKQGKTR